MKAKWLPAIVVPGVVILGIIAAESGAAAANGGATTPANGVTTTANFAGYAAVAKPEGTVTSFTSAQATLTVPAVNCTSSASSADQLVFIGDTLGNFQDDNSVAVSETCQNGSPTYSALAISPCNGHNLVLFPVNPGDTVKVSVDNTGDELADDLTTNQSGSNPLGTPCGDDSSAGVLTVGGFGQAIANFTQAGFRQIQVQGHGQSTPVPLRSSAWTLAHYLLKGSSGKVDVQPEALLQGQFTSAFANDWLAAS